MRDGGDDRFLAAVGRLPTLRDDQERRLARRARTGDADARDALVRGNLRLVVHLARRVPRAGTLLSLSDLVQEGSVGLATAVDRYDPTIGPRFGAFARWYILDALREATARGRRGVRLPVQAHRRLRMLQQAETRLTTELRRVPTTDELADDLATTPVEIHDLRRVATAPLSLDTPTDSEDGALLADLLPADPAERPEDRPLDVTALRVAVQDLPRTEQQVIALRFGLDGNPPRTFAEVGRLLHAEPRRVVAVERRALRRLRAAGAAA
jgi:RNA polymerase primary sigma factor